MESDKSDLAAFTRTMRGLLAVSKDELNEKLAAYERQKQARKAKRGTSGRASTSRSAT